MKACSRCKVEKPFDEFQRKSASPDGRQSYCRPCTTERMREYRPGNREKFHAADRRYYERNLEFRLAAGRAYYLENQERLQKYARDWRAVNPDYGPTYDKTRDSAKRISRNAVRRSRIKGLPAEKVDRNELYDRDGGRCHICECLVPRSKFHLDHLIPVVHGGGYTADNLRVAHPACNSRRGAGRLPAQLLLIG